MRRTFVALLIALSCTVLYAQSTTHKSSTAAHPTATGPTKVTGDGVKTDSGLQYWDIKVGTGEVEHIAVIRIISFEIHHVCGKIVKMDVKQLLVVRIEFIKILIY